MLFFPICDILYNVLKLDFTSTRINFFLDNVKIYGKFALK